MKNGAGLLLIIVALFSLWAYNTGRASAILAIIKGTAPGLQPAITNGGKPVTTSGSGGGGNPILSAACAASAAGDISPTCIDQIFGLATDPSSIIHTVEQGVNSVTSIFGVKLF